MLTTRMSDSLALAAVNEIVAPRGVAPVYEAQFKYVVRLVWVFLTGFVCFMLPDWLTAAANGVSNFI